MAKRRLHRSVRTTLLGMAANVLLASIKLTAGVLGNSYALVADAVESLADVFSSVVVWRGLVVAAAPADKEHPYGHGKAEPLSAAFVAFMLLAAAAGIIFEASREIGSTGHAPRPFTLVVLLVVVVVKEALFRYVRRAAGAVESQVMHADAWHHRSDAITSLAAAIGISIALIGGPGYAVADKIAAILAAGIIAWNGLRLLRPAVNELMDTSPGSDLLREIQSAAGSIDGVDRVEKCVARKMGYTYLVDMHVEVDPEMSVQRAHNIAHLVKDAVRGKLPQVSDVLVHIEPRGGVRPPPKHS